MTKEKDNGVEREGVRKEKENEVRNGDGKGEYKGKGRYKKGKEG